MDIILNLLNIFILAGILYTGWQANRLAKAIHEENKVQKENANKVFWGIIFSNILVGDRANLPKRMGALFEIFGTEFSLDNSGLDAETVKKAVNRSNSQKINELLDEVIQKKDQ
jgi:hypothetical protein